MITALFALTALSCVAKKEDVSDVKLRPRHENQPWNIPIDRSGEARTSPNFPRVGSKAWIVWKSAQMVAMQHIAKNEYLTTVDVTLSADNVASVTSASFAGTKITSNCSISAGETLKCQNVEKDLIDDLYFQSESTLWENLEAAGHAMLIENEAGRNLDNLVVELHTKTFAADGVNRDNSEATLVLSTGKKVNYSCTSFIQRLPKHLSGWRIDCAAK